MEEIRIDQTPTSAIWAFIPLYKQGLEEVNSWQIRYNGIDKLEIIINDEVTDTIEVASADALCTARKLYLNKLKDGHRQGVSSKPCMIKCMKASEYKPKSIKTWPVYTQPKLNGVRLLCTNDPLLLASSLGNPYRHLFHIEDDLKEFFKYLPFGSMLDGELYCHDLSFQQMVSAVKTTKVVHPNLLKLSYTIFDVNYNDPYYQQPYENRYALLINAFSKYLEDKGSFPTTFTIVQSKLANCHDDVLLQHDNYVCDGYEGIVVKRISNGVKTGQPYKQSLYKSGKNSNTLKYKAFSDEEGIVISTDNNNIVTVRANNNVTFDVRLKTGDKDVIGKKITYRYTKLLSDGVPDNPIGIAVRDYE